MKTNSIFLWPAQVCLFTFVLTGMLSAQTYYVDKNHASADNSNPGTIDLPWKSIGHAAETAVAGDQVFIRAGTYNESIYFDNNGSAEALIVFSAYAGEKPVVDGTGVSESQNGIIIDKSYIKIEGLEIRNWEENAVWVENAHHLEISDCEVHDVTYGIGLTDGSHEFVLNRVLVHHFALYGFDVTPSSVGDCYNGTFNDCVAHTGSDAEQNVDGFALGHGDQYGFTFNRCVTYNVYDGFDISSRNSTLNGCLAYNCWNGAYKLWQDQVKLLNCIGYDCTGSVVELDWDGTPGVVSLMNCTFYGGETFTVWVENHADALHMTNCIVAGGDNIGLAFEQMDVSQYQGDYNVFHNNNSDRAVVVGYTDEFTLDQITSGSWTTYSGQDAHSWTVNSAGLLFLNPAGYNFHLQGTGVAVDHGTNSGAPSDDFDGNPRYTGTGVDIGAYEINDGTGLEEIENGDESLLHCRNYPNPFYSATTISFAVPVYCPVTVKVYDLTGHEVKTLVHETVASGEYSVEWDGSDETGHKVAGGIYLCHISAGEYNEVRKMVIRN
ncbi:MAG: right-handed parallel beta-helix repeat-containing protein [Bacteroidales bacterium]|nr:right-handed parallel beta-helix repeat-containing protein [Bacteroidales bacterium]